MFTRIILRQKKLASSYFFSNESPASVVFFYFFYRRRNYYKLGCKQHEEAWATQYNAHLWLLIGTSSIDNYYFQIIMNKSLLLLAMVALAAVVVNTTPIDAENNDEQQAYTIKKWKKDKMDFSNWNARKKEKKDKTHKHSQEQSGEGSMVTTTTTIPPRYNNILNNGNIFYRPNYGAPGANAEVPPYYMGNENTNNFMGNTVYFRSRRPGQDAVTTPMPVPDQNQDPSYYDYLANGRRQG